MWLSLCTPVVPSCLSQVYNTHTIPTLSASNVANEVPLTIRTNIFNNNFNNKNNSTKGLDVMM